MSIQWKPDERALRFLRLCDSRNSDRPDDEVAKEYGLSLEALYRQLANDGSPVCPECGVLYPDKEHRREHVPRKRLARRGTGEAVELPRAAAALDMLRGAIEKMGSDLSLLHSRKEFYRDERFETVSDYPNASRTRKRAEFPPGEEGDREWRELCEEHNEDPNGKSCFVLEAPNTLAEGAPQAPPWPLTELIALYVLVGKPLEPLLEALHPDPTQVNEKRLHQAIEELRLKAGQLATLVRGGIIRRGPSTGELSPRDQNAARFISDRTTEGASETRTRELLEKHDISRSEFTRLKNLKIKPH